MNTGKRSPKNTPVEIRDNIVAMLASFEQMLPFLGDIDTTPIVRKLHELASKLGTDVQPVQVRANGAGEQPEHDDRIFGLDGKRYPRRPDPERPERVRALHNEGRTIREIARELGCSVGTVHRLIRPE